MAGSSASERNKPTNITYPSEWSDRERMSYLLAPFPPSSGTLNLKDPKFTFWSSLILSSSRELHCGVATESDLMERFRWEGTTCPACLSLVLEGMERKGDVTKLEEFFGSGQGSWLSWGASMMKKSISWALRSYLPGSKYEGAYVVGCVVKECAATVMAEHESTVLYKSTDNVMKCGTFEKLCMKVVPREMVPVLSQQLLYTGQLARAHTEHGHEVIKLSTTLERGLTVTDLDIGIVRIKDTVVTLSEQTKVLEEAIRRLKQLAKEKLKSGDRKGALRLLKHSMSKKSILESRESMLENVQDILHKIQSAETDAMVYQAYSSGVEAFRFMRESHDFTLEKVEDVVADLKEAIEEGDEITAVLGEGGALNNRIEDDELLHELLHELEGLMTQETEEIEKETGADLETYMAKLSIKEGEKEENKTFTDQLQPSVPGPVSKTQKLDKKPTPLLA